MADAGSVDASSGHGDSLGFNQLGVDSATIHRQYYFSDYLLSRFSKTAWKHSRRIISRISRSFRFLLSLDIKMSRASKLTLLGTSIGTAGIVYFVHWSQQADQAVSFIFEHPMLCFPCLDLFVGVGPHASIGVIRVILATVFLTAYSLCMQVFNGIWNDNG
jgi:hypothetical protein